MTNVERMLALLRNPSPLNEGMDVRDGLIQRYPHKKKVAIIGAFPSRAGAPLDDPEWEVWCCNQLYGACKDSKGRFRASRWFELHPLTQPPQSDFDLIGIQACPVPVYTLEHTPYFPMSVAFPIEAIVGTLYNARDYFTNTFSYQISLALVEGFQEIALYGIELTGGREYLLERPCVEYWVGYAQGRGVKVTIGEESALCWTPFRYGYFYEQEREFGLAIMRQHDGYYSLDGMLPSEKRR